MYQCHRHGGNCTSTVSRSVVDEDDMPVIFQGETEQNNEGGDKYEEEIHFVFVFVSLLFF